VCVAVCVAVCFGVQFELQCVAMRCSLGTEQAFVFFPSELVRAVYVAVCAAVCCSVCCSLQCMLQCVAVCCSVMQGGKIDEICVLLLGLGKGSVR